ncbi:MAG: hypothetical protein ACREOI_22745, partial [bacterium]
IGQVGDGLLPIVTTPRTVAPDTQRSGFTPTSATNIKLRFTYQNLLPINYRRPGFPDDLTITFSNTPLDTSLPAIGLPARPTRFRITTAQGSSRVRFRFRDLDNNGTLSRPYPDEFIDLVTYRPENPNSPQITWRVEIDTTGQAQRGPIVPPTLGDVYNFVVALPLANADVFSFKTSGQFIDQQKALVEARQEPYVVPNPYVGSASFEVERFAVSGRGERRMEFRALPANATIRIYTVRGELVQTLRHDGSNDGYVAWDLRTKDNLDIAPGLYIFHVEGNGAGTHIGKFAIIK